MSWSEWVLVFLGVGVILTLIRLRDERDVRDILGTVAIWPLWVAYYPIYRFKQWRKESARQARIAAKVADGSYTLEWARSLGWKGKP